MANSMLEDWDSEIENILWFLLWLLALLFVGGILYIHTYVCVSVCHTWPFDDYSIEKK